MDAAAYYDTSWSPCRLDDDSCLSLDEIMGSFSAPITEEHAWAIVFECVKCLHGVFAEYLADSAKSHRRRKVFAVTKTSQILLHRDGRVHESTFLPKTEPEKNGDGNKQSRVIATTPDKAVYELGLVIFIALDLGLKEDEERPLTPGLENLLDNMLSTGSDDEAVSSPHPPADTDDEGIEQDHYNDCDCDQPRSPCSSTSSTSTSTFCPRHRQASSSKVDNDKMSTLTNILALCKGHLSVSSEADAHYRNVCRALVSEALELSTFLQKAIAKEAEHSEELSQLALKDWAHLWIQTMNQLRHGVKLKKTNFTKTPIEYALTPYEILMDDIRSRRYKLNKVMVDGGLPARVKKDAHDVILDFIRSRPPLKPVSERVLAPRRRYSTPQELLMQSIRSTEAKSALRKTSGPPEPKLILDEWTGPLVVMEKPPGGEEDANLTPKTVVASQLNSAAKVPVQRSKSVSHFSSSSGPKKTVIRPDPNFVKFDPNNDDDSENDDVLELARARPPPTYARSASVKGSALYGARRSHRFGSLSNLSSVDETRTPLRSVSRGRVQTMPHVILSTPCGTIREEDPINMPKTRQRLSHSGCGTKTNSMVEKARKPGGLFGKRPKVAAKAGWRKLSSPAYMEALMAADKHATKVERKTSPTLNLSHSELAHIRGVLTRAKLESLSLDPDLKADVQRGKICFICMKSKFGFFTWSNTCRLCQQVVCSKCTTKVRIPEDRIDNVPIFALSPNSGAQSRSPSDQPGYHHPDTPIRQNPRHSLPYNPYDETPSRVRLRRSNTMGRYERPRSVIGDSPSLLSSARSAAPSPQVTVCLDCKQAVESMTQQQQRDDDDDNDDDNDKIAYQPNSLFSSRLRRQKVTKSLIFD